MAGVIDVVFGERAAAGDVHGRGRVALEDQDSGADKEAAAAEWIHVHLRRARLQVQRRIVVGAVAGKAIAEVEKVRASAQSEPTRQRSRNLPTPAERPQLGADGEARERQNAPAGIGIDRKSTRLNSSHL